MQALKGCANGASPGGTGGFPATHPRHWEADTCNGSGGAHVHWATSLEGPWHDGGALEMDTAGCDGCGNSNPAPWIFDNGTVLMIGRSKDQHYVGREHIFGHNLWLYRADSWNSTCELQNLSRPGLHVHLKQASPLQTAGCAAPA